MLLYAAFEEIFAALEVVEVEAVLYGADEWEAIAARDCEEREIGGWGFGLGRWG